MKVLDELMSAFCPQTSATGGMLHLSYIDRKPKPLSKKGLFLFFFYFFNSLFAKEPSSKFLAALKQA